MIRAFAAVAVLAFASPVLAQNAPPTAVLSENGLVAEYYAASPAVTARGAVVVLGGSEGGLDGSRGIARRLAAEGLDAVAVSYFGGPGQPTKLDLVPVEPVALAVDWLRARPDGEEPIGIVGASKGAELALLTASRDPRIEAVAVGVPSNVVWQGIDMAGGPTGSSWTAGGEPIAYLPYDLSKGFNGIYRLYLDSLPNATDAQEIPVERINGPILLVASRDDGLWPSADMADRLGQRLSAKSFTHEVERLTYDQGGHGVFGPPLSEVSDETRAALPFLGGSVETLVAARADGWPKVVDFLKRALAD